MEFEYKNLIFGRFSRFYKAKTLMDIILEGCILLETILSTSNNEISFQFATKISLLLGKNLEQRKKLFKLVKLFYEIRSKIVHEGGGITYQKNLKKLKNEVGDIKKFTNSLVRTILFHFFHSTEQGIIFMTKEQINTFLSNLVLGENQSQNQIEFQDKINQEFLEKYIKNAPLSNQN